MSNSILARFDLDYANFQLSVDLKLPDPGITVLFGQSGSGKTTLLRCIAGLQRPTHGFLQINGQPWQNSETNLFIPTHRRPLGYVFQEANLFPHLTVLGNLNFGLQRLGRQTSIQQNQSILELLGIEHLLERYPERLSGGERQRVAIARALILKPDLLLMDEPLASLDARRKQEILPFLNRLHRELHIPLLYVTHSLQEVAQLADHLVIMTNGQAVASGPLTDTLSRLDVPLAHDRDAVTVWPATVISHEEEYQLTRVTVAGGELSLPRIPCEVGTSLRIQIQARDVSIALDPPTRSSILNILPATIDSLTSDGAQTVVKLQVSDQPLLAHITHKSTIKLGLQTGMTVFAQIKGSSVLN